MAIDPVIQQKAEDIRMKIYGEQVRESLASGLEAMSSDVVEVEGRQDEVRKITENLLDGSYDQGLLNTEIENRMDTLYTTKGQAMDDLYASKESGLDTLYTTEQQQLDVLQQDYADRATTLETTYAPRLTDITAQLEHTRKFESNKDAIFKNLPVTPKAVRNTGGVIDVITRKPHGRGFVRIRLRDNQFTTNVSVGAPAQLLRGIEVLDVVECVSFLNAHSAASDPANIQTLPINYTVVGVGQQELPVKTTINKVAGTWIEYSVNAPKGINEIVALVYKSSGSSKSVNVSVDGEQVLTGLNFSGSGFERVVVPLKRSGAHTIRFTTTTAAHLNIAGVNVVDLQDYREGYAYDNLLNLVKTASDHYITSDGAMEYALLDGDTDLWCGSVHGGETRNRLQFILDGLPITLNDGEVKIGRVFEVEQDTNIVGKINAYSTQRFNGDGSIEHETIFDGDMNLKTLFTNMTTALDTFEEIVYPVRDNMVGKERIYLPQGINYVVQRNPDTLQKVTTIMNNKKIPSDSVIVPYIRKTVGAYNKVYNANIQSENGVNFKVGHFKTMHIFE